MKRTTLTLTLASLVLSASLLQAEVTRTEVSKKGEWIINSLSNEDGHFVGAEMHRTYNTKQEVHLRISFDGESFHLDSSADWSEIPDAKSHEAEYRIDGASESAWKGKAKVVEDADGMTWLRISQPNEPGVGDGLANAKQLSIYVGKIGESVEWVFDLKNSNAAYKEMLNCFDENMEGEEEEGETQEEAEAKSRAVGADKEEAAEGAELVEHEYARPGDWGVHYYTSGKGDALVRASMIRYFDDNSILRMSMDAENFHIDVSGDWKAVETAKGKKGDKVPVSIVLSEQAELEPSKETATLIEEEGDQWLRISQSLDEPSGMQDAVRNGEELNIIFSSKAKWTFDLKGSHAAWQKVDECIDKYGSDQ